MNDVRAMSICYRLLSRMDERTQDATMEWLASRLASDRAASRTTMRGLSAPDKAAIRRVVGDATMSLMALLKTTGAAVARRPVEMRGPMNVDVLVTVKRV